MKDSRSNIPRVSIRVADGADMTPLRASERIALAHSQLSAQQLRIGDLISVPQMAHTCGQAVELFDPRNQQRPGLTVTIRIVVNSALARAQQAELRQVAATIPTDTAQQGVQQTRKTG